MQQRAAAIAEKYTTKMLALMSSSESMPLMLRPLFPMVESSIPKLISGVKQLPEEKIVELCEEIISECLYIVDGENK